MIESYRPLIYSIVGKIVGPKLGTEAVQDIVQDVFLRLLDKSRRPEYDPTRGELKALIGTMAKTMSLDALRSHGRTTAHNSYGVDVEGVDNDDHDRPACAESALAHHDDALTMMIHAERREQLSSLIGKLPPDDQHFLIISARDDFDADEYARRLGILPVSLRVRKMRLMDKLRVLAQSLKD